MAGSWSNKRFLSAVAMMITSIDICPKHPELWYLNCAKQVMETGDGLVPVSFGPSVAAASARELPSGAMDLENQMLEADPELLPLNRYTTQHIFSPHKKNPKNGLVLGKQQLQWLNEQRPLQQTRPSPPRLPRKRIPSEIQRNPSTTINTSTTPQRTRLPLSSRPG